MPRIGGRPPRLQHGDDGRSASPLAGGAHDRDTQGGAIMTRVLVVQRDTAVAEEMAAKATARIE
jgi:hypothetical protein